VHITRREPGEASKTTVFNKSKHRKYAAEFLAYLSEDADPNLQAEDADPSLHSNLREEAVAGKGALPEATEPEQPAKDGRPLEVGEPAHELPVEPPTYGPGHVRWDAVKLLPLLR
jgi:hypothetical protein